MHRRNEPARPRPRVSIGMPVYNGEPYVAEAIESILAQTWDDLELVIADNASTDDTEAVCRQFADADPRVRYYRFDVNAGAAENYNRVFKLSRGEFFKWAAHDDICAPALIETCVRMFDAAPPTVAVVYPRAQFIDERGAVIGIDRDDMQTTASTPHRRLAHALRTVNMANAVFGLIRADILRRTRLIDSFIASDYVLLAELAMLGEYREVEQILLSRRLHPKSSREANTRNRDVAAWFNPTASSRGVLWPRGRLLLEYERSVRRLPLTARERIRCHLTIPWTFGLRRARVVGGRYKRRLKELGRGSGAAGWGLLPGQDRG